LRTKTPLIKPRQNASSPEPGTKDKLVRVVAPIFTPRQDARSARLPAGRKGTAPGVREHYEDERDERHQYARGGNPQERRICVGQNQSQ
jgi:hypothetical protein